MKHLFFIIVFSFVTLCVSAQNANVKRIGQTTYSAGCYERPFVFERIVQHEDDNKPLAWDWSACIQMALNYAGLNVTQDQVITQLNGPAETLIESINRTTPHDWGKDAKIYTTAATINADVLFEELAAGRPLIVGTRRQGEEGRAYILTAMSYDVKFDASGQATGITPLTVTLRDPWPNALATRIVNWPDFAPITAALYTVQVVFK